MIKEGILAAYLLWMAAVDAKTKTVPVWPGIAGILLFSVMGVVKGQGIPSLLGGIVIGVFCFTVSVLSRQAVGAGDGIVLGVTGAALGFFDNLEILMLALFFCRRYTDGGEKERENLPAGICSLYIRCLCCD